MKQQLVGAACVTVIAWALYVVATPNPCERVARGAAPARVTFDALRWAGQNWLSMDSRLTLLRWSIGADEATQSFLARQFYGPQHSCARSAG